MSPISAVGNDDLDHMIARVTLPTAARVPDRSSGDRAPETPEKPRRPKSAAHLPHRKSEDRDYEHFDEEPPPPEPPPVEDVQLYSPSRNTTAPYTKDRAPHNVDFRA